MSSSRPLHEQRMRSSLRRETWPRLARADQSQLPSTAGRTQGKWWLTFIYFLAGPASGSAKKTSTIPNPPFLPPTSPPPHVNSHPSLPKSLPPPPLHLLSLLSHPLYTPSSLFTPPSPSSTFLRPSPQCPTVMYHFSLPRPLTGADETWEAGRVDEAAAEMTEQFKSNQS